MVDETKRPTVAVTCGVQQGLKLQTYDPKRPETITLKPGLNVGVDKAFFEKWLEENSQASILTAGLLTHVDEKQEGQDQPDPWAPKAEQAPASE